MTSVFQIIKNASIPGWYTRVSPEGEEQEFELEKEPELELGMMRGGLGCRHSPHRNRVPLHRGPDVIAGCRGGSSIHAQSEAGVFGFPQFSGCRQNFGATVFVESCSCVYSEPQVPIIAHVGRMTNATLE